ncbi:ATP-binding protein [Butyrivibrio sp. NC2002]|uniref:ATP-binding protein n=1 Tax=Butyrivibrio sp. NC2002 TaxID=1410610 RepID=UPI000A67EB84|nr:HAMP domain-containing sensor histidine kinase [Butyrivibrio sp. NC2002]
MKLDTRSWIHQTTYHVTKGNGLGLALVKRVIDICGAEITVKSVLGKGTTSIVSFES